MAEQREMLFAIVVLTLIRKSPADIVILVHLFYFAPVSHAECH